MLWAARTEGAQNRASRASHARSVEGVGRTQVDAYWNLDQRQFRLHCNAESSHRLADNSLLNNTALPA